MTNSSDNKRIAKNTIFLYLRMFILLVVGLYTSRVTLKALGITDYGINNVVGGIVTMFVFINYAMVNSTQRYITYELGKNDRSRLITIFSTSVNIHAIISVIIIFLSETIGLWFLYNKMVIPPDRFTAALWIYQFSIASCVISIMSVPFNSLIIAHEKMSAFAYISLLDVTFRLLIVFLLLIHNGDRLILYGLLVLIVSIVDQIIYLNYCLRNFPESKYRWDIDKPLMKEMTGFASWNLVGNLAYVCYTQGLNLLLNTFFSPAVNAARGIAVQVQSTVANFSYNIENAIKPQITKSYAKNDFSRMHSLMSVSARLSYYVLLLMGLPLMLEADYVLNLWLVEVPSHTVNFLRLTILYVLSESLTGPLLTAIQSSGSIRRYQLTVSALCLLILPVSYIFLLIWEYPEVVFVVTLSFSILIQFVKLFIVCCMVKLSKWIYFKDVFIRSFVVSLFSLIFPTIIYLNTEQSFLRFTAVVSSSIIATLLMIYLLGITNFERKFVNTKAIYYIDLFKRN